MAEEDVTTFTSWKEIANYLGKGVRTVQRWETQLGLPVQRPNHKDKGIVRASREDLDKWVAAVWKTRHTLARSLAGELRILRKRITELTLENTTLKRELEQVRPQQISSLNASEPSTTRMMFTRMSDDIAGPRRRTAQLRDFAGNIRVPNQPAKTPIS